MILCHNQTYLYELGLVLGLRLGILQWTEVELNILPKVRDSVGQTNLAKGRLNHGLKIELVIQPWFMMRWEILPCVRVMARKRVKHTTTG